MERVTINRVTDLSLDQPMRLPLPGTDNRKRRGQLY